MFFVVVVYRYATTRLPLSFIRYFCFAGFVFNSQVSE